MTRMTHDEFVYITEKFNTGIASINVNIARLFHKKKRYVSVFSVTSWALTLPPEAYMLMY
jgi:hypothetical protein